MLIMVGKMVLLIGCCGLFNLTSSQITLYEKSKKVELRSELDSLLRSDWESHGLTVPNEASDAVLVRRAYIDIMGRLPTPDEAASYLQSPDFSALLERLLADRGFADYWTMRWGDILRVKSEFPINLWPNAVYGYSRRIHSFLLNNEPYDSFVSALLLSQGSNFRVPEANFYRATARRTPEGIADAVALTFLGMRTNDFSTVFSPVGYKNTKEWKEEIVFIKSQPDPRIEFTKKLIANPYFAKSAVNRIWYWFFGYGLVNDIDDMREDNPAVNPALLDFLASEFVKSGYDYRNLCRLIVNSASYRASSFSKENIEQSMAHFALYPVRRMDAEVLADAIEDITGVKSSFVSMIPEPYTYIPKSHRTIHIEDGSINSAFLTLFGRPSRDNGLVSERSNTISTKQRLYLHNSIDIYNRLKKIAPNRDLKKLNIQKQTEMLFWLFYSRSPSLEELKIIREYQHSSSAPRKNSALILQDVAWVLLNSEEFIHQH